MKPKWMNNKDTHRQKSDKRVKKVAKKYGAKVVANSGATPWSKGDLKLHNNMIEHKMTGKKSYKLNKSDLLKLYSDAVKEGMNPIFMIDFGEVMLTGCVRKIKL